MLREVPRVGRADGPEVQRGGPKVGNGDEQERLQMLSKPDRFRVFRIQADFWIQYVLVEASNKKHAPHVRRFTVQRWSKQRWPRTLTAQRRDDPSTQTPPSCDTEALTSATTTTAGVSTLVARRGGLVDPGPLWCRSGGAARGCRQCTARPENKEEHVAPRRRAVRPRASIARARVGAGGGIRC